MSRAVIKGTWWTWSLNDEPYGWQEVPVDIKGEQDVWDVRVELARAHARRRAGG